MSKELETIKYLLEQCVNESIKKDLLDIETALKDYETRKVLIETIDSGEMVFQERNIWEEKQKKLRALKTISQNFRLVGNCLHAKNKYAEDGWVFVKEIEDEEELEAWKEALYEQDSM